MREVVVTGGCGLLGPWIIKELIQHGYDVTHADVKKPAEELCPTVNHRPNRIRRSLWRVKRR